MAEMRAVWRRSQRVLGSSDSTDQGALLTPLRSVTDSNWELQHKRGSRFRDPSPRYTQVQARQDRMRIVEESEDDSNSQVLLMISSQELDNRECFGCDTSHSPTTAESEGNSTNETDWSVAEFKHSVAVNRKCSSPDKVEENLDENDDDSDPKQVLASKDNERRLKQPKPVRQSTRASQLNLCSTSNNSSATKLDTLRSGQESKENTDRAGLDCKTTTLLSNNRRTTDVQHRRQVKHAVVRHIRTVVGDHVTQLQRSFGPRTSEMLRAKSGSNIPRTKPKHHPTKDARSTERKETCAKARAKDACRNESGSNSQDQTATNDRYISDIVAESETGLGKELGTLLDSGPVEPTQPLTVSSADIGTTSEKNENRRRTEF